MYDFFIRGKLISKCSYNKFEVFFQTNALSPCSCNYIQVNQVINITDIDDKIIDKVNSGEIGYKELTAKFNDIFFIA